MIIPLYTFRYHINGYDYAAWMYVDPKKRDYTLLARIMLSTSNSLHTTCYHKLYAFHPETFPLALNGPKVPRCQSTEDLEDPSVIIRKSDRLPPLEALRPDSTGSTGVAVEEWRVHFRGGLSCGLALVYTGR